MNTGVRSQKTGVRRRGSNGDLSRRAVERFPHRGSSQSGVTLLELLVVVALASILLAVVFPSVGAGIATLELRSSAQRLAAAARYARDQAVFRQRAFQLEIDGRAGAVAVMDTAGEARRRFEFPASVRVEQILPAEEETAARTRRFLFLPDGEAPQFEVVLGNERRRVTVVGDPLTGAAKVSE